MTCSSPVPKPFEYFRIDLPTKEYFTYKDTNCGYAFKLPKYSEVKEHDPINKCWKDINFQYFKATIHLTYFFLEKNLNDLIEESRRFAYKHTIKADAIKEVLYIDTVKKVYGILYDISGNVATPIQFYVTDSVKHFLRGALYFNTRPNKDSLEPVIDFLKLDVKMLIETIRWLN